MLQLFGPYFNLDVYFIHLQAFFRNNVSKKLQATFLLYIYRCVFFTHNLLIIN